jgi:extracellular factor (EF) 3-hydroxypalmitic acid methyl ester biosynthesis protein
VNALASPTAAPATFEEAREWIAALVERGGPAPEDFAALDRVMRLLPELSGHDVGRLRAAFGDALDNPATLQGFAYLKPRGYPGDFEIIDRIYERHVNHEERLASWDRYFHAQPAAQAVRNRKDYFHALLDRHAARVRPLRVLNLASGPGRCMAEWLEAHRDADVSFTCIELDAAAIQHARELTRPFAERVTFREQNLLRFTPLARYDLIWAAGICDYLTESVVTRLVRRLRPALAPGGELVLGNFSGANPSRPYMEILGEWRLHHRSAHALRQIAHHAGIPAEAVTIGAEPEGVNLFLHITAPNT